MVVPIYLAAVIACCVLCLLALRQRESTEQSALARATLIVSPSDVDTRVVAAALGRFERFKVLRADQPGAGREIVRLAGGTDVTTPLLAVPLPSGLVRYSGQEAVQKALAPLVTAANRYTLGEKALVIIACMAIFCAFFSAEIGRIVLFLPALAVVAFMGLPGSCLACGTIRDGPAAFASLAPFIGLIHVLLASVVVAGRWYRKPVLAWGLAAFTCAVPFAQSVALVFDPKLCPSCLAYGFVALGYGSVLLSYLGGVPPAGVLRLSAVTNGTLATMLLLLASRNALFLAGRLSLPEGEPQSSADFVGHSLTEYVADPASSGSRVVLVTLDGCSHCDDAKRAFRRHNLAFEAFEPGRTRGPGTFFVPTTTSVPIVLITDSNNKIIYQRNGWIAREGEELLVAELQKEITHGKQNQTPRTWKRS